MEVVVWRITEKFKSCLLSHQCIPDHVLHEVLVGLFQKVTNLHFKDHVSIVTYSICVCWSCDIGSLGILPHLQYTYSNDISGKIFSTSAEKQNQYMQFKIITTRTFSLLCVYYPRVSHKMHVVLLNQMPLYISTPPGMSTSFVICPALCVFLNPGDDV